MSQINDSDANLLDEGVFITSVLLRHHSTEAGIYEFLAAKLQVCIEPRRPPPPRCLLTCVIIPPARMCIGGTSAYPMALDSKLTPEIPVGVMIWRGPVNGPLSPLTEGGCTALGKGPRCD